MRVILTISGFDPSGGAGIHADIKTVRCVGMFPVSVLTALTAQNTCGVYEVRSVDAELIELQLERLLEDVRIDAVKIGLVAEEDVAEVIAERLREIDVPKVLDPVIFAGSGGKIGSENAYAKLLQCVDVATPNLTEAKILSGKEDVIDAGRELRKHVKAVIITGGELNGRDHVFEEREYVVEAEFSPVNVHGTGCVYSTALACYLAAGRKLEDAARLARILTLESVKRGVRVGKCSVCVNP